MSRPSRPTTRTRAPLVRRLSRGVALGIFACAMACDSSANSPEAPVQPPAAAIPAAEAKPATGAEAAPADAGSADAATGAQAATGEAAPATGEAAPTGAADDEAGEAEGEEGAEAASGEQEEADAAAEPVKVLLIGDSLIATGFGVLVEKGLDAHPQVTCYRKGKSASGLARPDFFDWMDEAKKQIEFRQPEIVVAVMGGNDGQDLRSRSGKGIGAQWPSEAWNQGYRERMDALLAELAADERKVIWVALPPMGMRSLEKKLVTIREIQKAAVDAMGDRAVYVETAPFLLDDEGNLEKYGVVKGKKREIRADDGIHFTMSGSEFLADLVVPALLNELGVDDVEG